VIAFDPRHGSTCHPAHRALGGLVLEATRRVAVPPEILLVETLAERLEDGDSIRLSRFAPEDRRAMSFEGETARGDHAGGTAWDYLTDDARIHASQFSQKSVADLAAVPAGEQEIRLLRRGRSI
jgi:LmbE family N-acetylglucosaminyl deacetylase